MKINKTNLAFGTLLCAATLSSMLMAHSNMVHADVQGANMQQGVAAMHFDEDVQDDVQTPQVKNSADQTMQNQRISTVYSVNINEQSREDNVAHEAVQHTDTTSNAVNNQNGKSRNMIDNVAANENKQQNVKNKSLKPNKTPLIIKNMTDADISGFHAHFVDRYGHEIDKLKIDHSINDLNLSYYFSRYKDTSIDDYMDIFDYYHVLGQSNRFQINHSTRDMKSPVILKSNLGSINLTMNQSQHLFDLINKDVKSKSILMDWSKLKTYDDFSNYLYDHDYNDGDGFHKGQYNLILSFPHDDKMSLLDARKAENMALIGSDSDNYDYADGTNSVKNRLNNPKLRVDVGKEDPEFAQNILNQLAKQVDANIINGTQDIGVDSFEKYNNDLYFTLKSRGMWKQDLYTFKDLTGMAYRDTNNPKQIDVPIWEPKTVKKHYAVTRIIQINFPDGVVPRSYYDICNRHGIIRQRLEYNDITTTDGITGELISHGLYNGYNDDEPVSGFSESTLPKIPSYTLHIYKVSDKA